MAGNTFGQAFTLTTFGESHGPALGAVVDGCPPGLALDAADLQRDLDRRRPGQSRYTTQRREPDEVRILSGVFEGVTTGTSIGLAIDNVDQRPRDYGAIKDQFRPAHADFTYHAKYGRRDYRGGGRASARETAMRVAAGAIARKYLAERAGVAIRGYLAQIGELELRAENLDAVNDNPFFSPDPQAVDDIAALIDALRRDGDSIGAKVVVVASNVPVGLGEPVFGKLDADPRRRPHGHQRRQGRGVRRRLRRGVPARQRTPRRTRPHRLPLEQRRRRPRRHLLRPGHHRQNRPQANIEHRQARP